MNHIIQIQVIGPVLPFTGIDLKTLLLLIIFIVGLLCLVIYLIYKQ